MATLQKIRNRAGLLIGVIGIALLAFILGDLLTSGNTFFRKYQDKAFSVNGEIVATQEYFDRVSEWEEFQKQMSGQSSLDENATAQIREIVYQQMVRERVLDAQAKKLGLSVSKEEVNDLVHGENISPMLRQLPLFVNQQTGAFDKAMLEQFLTVINTPAESLQPQQQGMIGMYKTMWLFIENLIKYQRLEEKYGTLLSNAVMVNEYEAKKAFELSQQNADIAYAVQNYFTVSDSTVTVTDADIKKYYNTHKSSFKQDVPLAKVSYFVREVNPSDADFAEVEKESQEAYRKLLEAKNTAAVVADYSDVPFRDVYRSEKTMTPDQQSFIASANVSDIYGPVRDGNNFKMFKLLGKTVAPDSIKLRMISVPDSPANDSLVTQLIDSIYNVIDGGKSIEEVANELNPQSNGGNVGWVREIDLITAGSNFVAAVFNAPTGKVSKIKMTGQQSIFIVEEKTAPVAKYKLAVVNMPVIVSEKTQNNIDNELNQFVSAPESKTKFDKFATEKGYAVIPNATLRANDFMLAQMPSTRQVVSWAVNAKKGEVKKFDLSDKRIIAQVNRVYSSGNAPIEEVSDAIRMKLINDKKAEKIIADLNAKNSSTLNDFALAMNTKVDTVRFVNFNTANISGLGSEPTLNAVSTYAPLQAVQGPMRGNMGVYVATVSKRSQSDGTYDAKSQKMSMQSAARYRMQAQSIEVLKTKLNVQDNRYKFY